MKKLLLVMVTIYLCQIGNAQQLFTDSGQRLGNSVSWEVKLGDLDNDGDLDAVVANWEYEKPSLKNEIWLNNGMAVFTSTTQIISSSQNVILHDMNSDGYLDVITIQDSVKIFINDGDANFTQSQNNQPQEMSLCFDNKLTGIEKDEVVTMRCNNNITVLKIYSVIQSGVLLRDSIIINGFAGSCLAIGDLNKDGYSDIAISGEDTIGSTFRILFNDKNDGFNMSEQEFGNYAGYNLYLGDLNNDDYLDILQSNYHNPEPPFNIYPAQFYLNDSVGNFNIAFLPYNTSYITPNAALVDLDNDSDLDIYMNHGHQFSSISHKSEILFNDGNANFTTSTISLQQINSVSVAFGDLDNDGDKDAFLAVGDYELSIGPDRVWLNNTVTSVSDDERIPENFNLFQNYPNPFNPTTNIQYSLSKPSQVKLSIYNLLGQVIKLLTNSFQNAGEYTLVWDATDNENNPVSSGIYFYRLETSNNTLLKKMVFLK
jgi:hypothetical protein